MNNSSNHRACQREDTGQLQRERWENCASCIHSLRTDLEFFLVCSHAARTLIITKISLLILKEKI